MNKKIAAVLGLLCLLGLWLLQGCSKKESGETQPAAQEAAAPAATPIDPATVASVSGTVSFDGAAPKAGKIDMSQDPACKGTNEAENIVVSGGKLTNVFVYVKEGLGDRTFDAPKDAATIDQLLAQEPEVHFVFQSFPLPMHNWAGKAADYLDCVGQGSGPSAGQPASQAASQPANDQVWKFIQKTFDEQANITASNIDEKLKAIATAAGANADDIAACAAKPDTKARVEASVALGKSVGVTGTPVLFINGRSVPGGAPVDLLKKIVEFEASQK